jgi:hypothetical protein
VKLQSLTRKCGRGANFFGGSDARIIMSSNEGALIRLPYEQNVEMKSERSLGVTTGDPPHTRDHAAKSPTAQAHCLLPIGRKYSRARHRGRQTAANLTAFMAGIRRFMKA